MAKVTNKTLPINTKFNIAIGTKFKYSGINFTVAEPHQGCEGCFFHANRCMADENEAIREKIGNCAASLRDDNTQIIFVASKDDNTSIPFTGRKEQTGSSEADAATEYNVQDIFPLYKNNNALRTIKINPPDSYEIDVDNSSLSRGIINFKRKEHITLGDVYDTLIDRKVTSCSEFINLNGNIPEDNYYYILYLANLLDIAKYYNGDWKADFNNDEYKYYITYDSDNYNVRRSTIVRRAVVIFKNIKDAQSVIDNPNFREILDGIYKQ